MKIRFFKPMLKEIKKIVKSSFHSLLTIPVVGIEIEPTIAALHNKAEVILKTFSKKLKVDEEIDEVRPFFRLAEFVYRWMWKDATQELNLLIENSLERLRPILEEKKPELLESVRKRGYKLLRELTARITNRVRIELDLDYLAEALDEAYCKAFRIVKEKKTTGGSSKSPKGGGEDPYFDYIEELKRYKISTFHSLRAHRYMEMIKALPDFEPVPYYTYEVEPATLREALGWIDRESFRTLLAYKIIYKDDVWRIKERLTLPEFTALKSVADKHDIKVDVVEEAR